MYKKILFCTDLYPGSDFAFISALETAAASDAELIVLHVLESRNRYSGHVITEDGEVWASKGVLEKLKQKLREYYLYRIEEERQHKVKFIARAGIPWLEILRTARKENVDLIVLGSYTIREGAANNLEALSTPHLGENAQQVSLRARCPVSIITSPKQRQLLKDE